jgi:hypothetical protein
MYTKLDDAKHANKINAYIKVNPNATRKLIIKDCITNWYRLKYLEQQGLIALPAPTPHNIRNKEYLDGR